MHLQPGGRQGHIPDMSWLNKAIYQHRVDTAELGTESQRALAPGPRNTQRARGELGAGKVSPASAPRQETHGHCCAHGRETTRVPPRLRAAPGIPPNATEFSWNRWPGDRATARAEPRGAVSLTAAPLPRDASGSGGTGSKHRQPCCDPSPRTHVSQGLIFPGAGAQHRGSSGSCWSGVPGLHSWPRVAQSSLQSTSPRRDVRHPELRGRGYGRSLPSSLPSRTCRGWAGGGSRTHLGTGGDRVRRARRKL